MPIAGVTDREREFSPRIAKIRLGVKRQSQRGNEYPSDVDYFVLTDAPEVAAVYGDKPKQLIIQFHDERQESIFPTRLESWKSSGQGKEQRNKLFCNSDGRTATRIYTGPKDAQGHEFVMAMPEDERPEPGELFNMPCPHEDCPYFDSRACKRVGRLNFILPEVTFKGTYQIETSSMWGFGNVLDFLNWMRKMTRDEKHPNGWFSVGRGAYFYLRRVPTQMVVEGKTIVKHVLSLELLEDDAVAKLRIKIPSWMKAVGMKGLQALPEAVADRPEDLFPANGEDMKAIPEILPPEKPDPPARTADPEPEAVPGEPPEWVNEPPPPLEEEFPPAAKREPKKKGEPEQKTLIERSPTPNFDF